MQSAECRVESTADSRGWAAVTWKCHSALQAWTPGVTWCYLECYLVLPGVLPGVTWRYLRFYFGVVFFCGPKISAFLKLKLWEKNQFPPGDVTWAHACSRYLFTWPTLWLALTTHFVRRAVIPGILSDVYLGSPHLTEGKFSQGPRHDQSPPPKTHAMQNLTFI